MAPPWKGRWRRWYSYSLLQTPTHSTYSHARFGMFVSTPGLGPVRWHWGSHSPASGLSIMPEDAFLWDSQKLPPQTRESVPFLPCLITIFVPLRKIPVLSREKTIAPTSCFMTMWFIAVPSSPFLSLAGTNSFQSWGGSAQTPWRGPREGGCSPLLSPQITHWDCLFCTETDLKTSQF